MMRYQFPDILSHEDRLILIDSMHMAALRWDAMADALEIRGVAREALRLKAGKARVLAARLQEQERGLTIPAPPETVKAVAMKGEL